MLILGIQSRELKLLEFVQLLGEYLTHEETKIRKCGIAATLTDAHASAWMSVRRHRVVPTENNDNSGG